MDGRMRKGEEGQETEGEEIERRMEIGQNKGK